MVSIVIHYYLTVLRRLSVHISMTSRPWAISAALTKMNWRRPFLVTAVCKCLCWISHPINSPHPYRTSDNAALFYNEENTDLTLYDATSKLFDTVCDQWTYFGLAALTPAAFNDLARRNPFLTNLRLDFCGRIDDSVMDTWATFFPNLQRIELLGPFLVRVPGWKTFFQTHTRLEGFLITQSPRFDLECTQVMVENCKNIKELRLNEIGKMEDAILEELKKYGDQLTYLELARPSVHEALSESALVDLMSAVGKNLTHLNLENNVNLTDGFLYQGLKPHARNLETLILRLVSELTDAGVAEFFNTWSTAVKDPNPPLFHLDFARNYNLADKALEALLRHSSKEVTHLDINGWKATSREALSTIATQCPELQKLDMGWCRELDDGVVQEVLEKCGKIREIKVWGCQRISLQCPRKVSNLCHVYDFMGR